MRAVDLSQVIEEGMPAYPGTEGPRISQATTIEGAGFAEKLLTMYSHTGTHLDAPAHILPGSPSLDELPMSSFAGRALVADLRGRPGAVIGVEELGPYLTRLRGLDFLLLRTGWEELWGRSSYFEGFPVLSPEASRALAALGLKGLGLDAISVDEVGSTEFPNHKAFLSRGMVVVENLRGLGELGSGEFLFCCPALKLRGGDGSPVRAFALLDS